MTHEEALCKVKGYLTDIFPTENYSEVEEIIKALEQQPCDDAISRQSVFNAIEQEDKWLLSAKGHNGLTEIAFSGLKARVDALPSVTQKSAESEDKTE